MIGVLAVAAAALWLLVAVLRCRSDSSSLARRDRAGRAALPPAAAVVSRPASRDGEHDVRLHADLGGPPSSAETCDRCSSAAVAAVYLQGGRLLLCGHHGRAYESVLRQQGAVIVGTLAFVGRLAQPAPRRA